MTAVSQRNAVEPDTVGGAVRQAIETLTAAGVENPRLDAQVLLGFVLKVTREEVFGYPERNLSQDEKEAFGRVIERRSSRQPVAQIIGQQEFWGRLFKVSPDTLIPRPDSETVIATVLEHLPPALGDAPIRILDLGTGTGCLLLTLLAEISNSVGTGVDASTAALEIARENGRALNLEDRVQFVKSDWCSALSPNACFDIVVSNPPYIADGEVAELEPEVSNHEPAEALCGGPDGLDAYRRLGPQLAGVLAPGGIVAFEVGAGQIPEVRRLLEKDGLEVREIVKDLAGIERCIICVLAKKNDLRSK